MGSLKETKKRIISVKNTQKITRAMKLVSSAKYARSIRSLVQARPYREGLADLALRLMKTQDSSSHYPLLSKRTEKKVLVLLIATDRGLCGSLNTNLFKKTQNFIKEAEARGSKCSLGLWGRKAVAFGSKLDVPVWKSVDKQLIPFPFTKAGELADELIQEFLNNSFDAVYVSYAHYENALTQRAATVKILPLTQEFLQEIREQKAIKEPAAQGFGADLLEPGREALLPHLLSSFVAAEVFHYFLSSVASEHAARMTAMDNATNNADEVISNLTLEYNQARQAAITKELIEITSGAEAL